MTETFYHAMCEKHEWVDHTPFVEKSKAEIGEVFHQQQKSCDEAEVVTFESEAVGSLPKESVERPWEE
jgi:hypothetical protein